MNRKSRILAACLLVAASLPVAAGAAEQDKAKKKGGEAKAAGETGRPVELGSFLCKDIMRMSGDDRQIALAVLHGYYLGKRGATSYVSGALSKASDDFVEYCLDNPSARAFDSFAKFAR